MPPLTELHPIERIRGDGYGGNGGNGDGDDFGNGGVCGYGYGDGYGSDGEPTLGLLVTADDFIEVATATLTFTHHAPERSTP